MTKVKTINDDFIGMYMSLITGAALAFILVLVTGVRSISDLLSLNIWLLITFGIAEFLVIICFIYHLKNHLRFIKYDSLKIRTYEEYSNKKSGNLIIFVSFILSMALNMLGLLCSNFIPSHIYNIINLIFIVSATAILSLFPLNVLGLKCFTIYRAKEPLSYWQYYFTKKRENFPKSKGQLIASLVTIKLISRIYLIVLGILGILLAFSVGVVQSKDDCFMNIFITSFPIMAVLSRFKFNEKKHVANPKNILPRDEFPTIYEICDRAAHLSSANKPYTITISTTTSAAITELADSYIIDIGYIVLGQCSEDELLCILLHEFEHVSLTNADREYSLKYNNWVRTKRTTTQFYWLTDMLFAFGDTLHNFKYKAFDYASSIQRELTADKAMLKADMPETAASSLIKIHMYPKYEYLTEYHPRRKYINETPSEHQATDDLIKFNNFVETNFDLLVDLFKKEIICRSSSHPILRDRLAVLGVDEYKILYNEKAPSFIEEATKAIELLDKVIYDDFCTFYDKYREELYLKPLETIEEWIDNDKEVTLDNFYDIVNSLSNLERYDELEAICDDFIDSTDYSISVNAKYIKGRMLLYRLDPSGIPLLYDVSEKSFDFSVDALNEINLFCCLTGNEEELSKCRKKAPQYYSGLTIH